MLEGQKSFNSGDVGEKGMNQHGSEEVQSPGFGGTQPKNQRSPSTRRENMSIRSRVPINGLKTARPGSGNFAPGRRATISWRAGTNSDREGERLVYR